MTHPAGLILAGGLSRRMGENKALMPFGQARLVDHAVKRLTPQCATIAVNSNQPIPKLGDIPLVPDDIAGYAGPLAGVAAGLRHASRLANGGSGLLTTAVDTPFFPEDLAERLAEAVKSPNEIAVAADTEGNWHPAFSLWPLSVEEDLRQWLADPENRKVRAFIERHPHRLVAFPLIEERGRSIEPFFNINTPADYRRALSFLEDEA